MPPEQEVVKSAVRYPVRLPMADPDLRQLKCAEQSFCLGVAASLDWPGMACTECHGYAPQTTAEYRRDLEGIAMLWLAIRELGWWERTEP